MKVIRTSNNNRYTLNEGDLQARGLWMIFDNTTEECSVWFDEDEMKRLVQLSDKKFTQECDDKLTYGSH